MTSNKRVEINCDMGEGFGRWNLVRIRPYSLSFLIVIDLGLY